VCLVWAPHASRLRMNRVRIVLGLRPQQVAWLKASQHIAGYGSVSEYARALLDRVMQEDQARDTAPLDRSQARQEQG
jgi:hypothetical protein